MRSVAGLCVAVLLAIGIGIGVLAGMGRGASGGTVLGTLARVGGPAPGAPVPVRGEVTLTKLATRVRFSVRVGRDGRFEIAVPTGRYRVDATTPDVVYFLADGTRREGRASGLAVVVVARATTTTTRLVFSVS